MGFVLYCYHNQPVLFVFVWFVRLESFRSSTLATDAAIAAAAATVDAGRRTRSRTVDELLHVPMRVLQQARASLRLDRPSGDGDDSDGRGLLVDDDVDGSL